MLLHILRKVWAGPFHDYTGRYSLVIGTRAPVKRIPKLHPLEHVAWRRSSTVLRTWALVELHELISAFPLPSLRPWPPYTCLTAIRAGHPALDMTPSRLALSICHFMVYRGGQSQHIPAITVTIQWHSCVLDHANTSRLKAAHVAQIGLLTQTHPIVHYPYNVLYRLDNRQLHDILHDINKHPWCKGTWKAEVKRNDPMNGTELEGEKVHIFLSRMALSEKNDQTGEYNWNHTGVFLTAEAAAELELLCSVLQLREASVSGGVSEQEHRTRDHVQKSDSLPRPCMSVCASV